MLGLAQAGASKKCHYCCKLLSLDAFAINSKTGSLYSRCKPCRPKYAEVQAAHKKTDKGKATRKRARTSEKGKAAEKRFRTSEKGKASQKRARTSEKGKAAVKRATAKRQERRQESPAMRLACNIKRCAALLITGRNETSPTFLKRTLFDSEAQFLEHMKSECSKNGLVFEDRGSWTIDRKIPEEAYDFDNPNDVLRCWSPSNITAMTHSENMEKSWKLIDSWIASAGSACYPVSWKGRRPTEEMKKDHHDRMIAPKPVGEQLEAPVSNESDSESEEYESDSEEEFEACGDQGAGSSSNAGRERTVEDLDSD